MRQNLLAAIIFALAATVAHAQVGEARRDFSVGGFAGCTMNSISFVPKIKQAQKISPSFGFSSRYVCEKYFNSICAVQMELQYNNLGWKEVIEDESGNEYYRDMHYIHLPLLMQMGWGKERNGLKFLFEAGPQFGLYLDGEEHKDIGTGTFWNPYHRPNGVNYQYDKDIDNKLDYGIAAGIGLEHSNPLGHFLLQARYYYGLGDTFDNSKRGKFGRSANQTISIHLAYLFDIIKTKR